MISIFSHLPGGRGEGEGANPNFLSSGLSIELFRVNRQLQSLTARCRQIHGHGENKVAVSIGHGGVGRFQAHANPCQPGNRLIPHGPPDLPHMNVTRRITGEEVDMARIFRLESLDRKSVV